MSSYKKVRTIFINDKKKVIYMKPKGTREYIKSKGEMVLLTSYLKKIQKVAAKKAMASKLAKKSPNLMMKTKYVRKGGFFFQEEGGDNAYNSMITNMTTTPQQIEIPNAPPGGGQENFGLTPGSKMDEYKRNEIDGGKMRNEMGGGKMRKEMDGGKMRKAKANKNKKGANPFKNIMDSLALVRKVRKVRKGKKRGGGDTEDDLNNDY